MSDIIEEISDLEAVVSENEPEPPPDNSPIRNSKTAFMAGIVLVDGVTAYTVYLITTYWYYGVLWFLAGAISFYLHQKNWERAGNNVKQEKSAKDGMIAAVAGMMIVGLYAAVVLVMRLVTLLTEGLIVGGLFGLFFFHLYQFAVYYFSDDDWIIARQIAKAEANARKHVKIIKAGDRVVAAGKEALTEKDRVYKKHGDKGAVDAAIGKISGNKPKNGQGRPQNAPQSTQRPAMVKDTESVELETSPNANGGGSK